MTKLIQTTKEVYAAIMKEHRSSMKVFSSYSAPCGDYYGDSERSVMMTEWGFEGANKATIKTETTWTTGYNGNNEFDDEKTEYWLVLSVSEDD